jgi:hypothetical protein
MPAALVPRPWDFPDKPDGSQPSPTGPSGTEPAHPELPAPVPVPAPTTPGLNKDEQGHLTASIAEDERSESPQPSTDDGEDDDEEVDHLPPPKVNLPFVLPPISIAETVSEENANGAAPSVNDVTIGEAK